MKDILALILDLDGVVTNTARIHTHAWKQLFDEYNERRKARREATYQPFETLDYLRYVDGKPRIDGIGSFLESRGIRLPMGSPNDSTKMETVFGLGNRKNELFLTVLEKTGPMVFPDAVEALHLWRKLGLKTAIASSSKNCQQILRLAHLENLFDVRVDGTNLEKWKLRGKPAPDMFLKAAQLLNVSPIEAALLEDAIAGIQAARAGHFGFVVGVARFGNPERLMQAGADKVVSKLTELTEILPERPPLAA